MKPYILVLHIFNGLCLALAGYQLIIGNIDGAIYYVLMAIWSILQRMDAKGGN